MCVGVAWAGRGGGGWVCASVCSCINNVTMKNQIDSALKLAAMPSLFLLSMVLCVCLCMWAGGGGGGGGLGVSH